MDDFIQTMKDWRRMCKHYTDESLKAEQLSCVDICPLGHNTVCGIIEDALDSDIEVMAKEVAKWTAEHPEPIYPTWGDWLAEIGLISWEKGDDGVHSVMVPTFKMCTRMPSDIAEKLDVKPKER